MKNDKCDCCHCHCCCCECDSDHTHENKNCCGEKDMNNKECLLKKKEKLEKTLAEINKKLKELK